MNVDINPKKSEFKMHKASFLMIAAAVIIVAFIFLSPVFSQSTSPCGSCHGGYSQYLDVLEGNAANQLPTALTVGQTATVSVVVENRVNTASFTSLSSVSLTLSSQNGRFSVSVPTYNVGTLQKGTTTATWQITGVSAGSDSLVISASARNSHQNLQFSDTYSPSLAITVSAPTSTPTPAPTASPAPTPTQPPTPTPTPTSGPTPTPVPTSQPTPTPTISPTPIPTSTPSPTTAPTTTPTPTPTPLPTPTPVPTVTPTPTPNPTLTPTPEPTSTPNPTTNPSPTSTLTSDPTPTPTLAINQTQTLDSNPTPTTTPNPTSTTSTTPEPTTNQTLQSSSTPTLRVWFRHPNIDEAWIIGTRKTIEWETSYGASDLVAKLELSKSGIGGPWITLAENLTNLNYYSWKVPSLEQNDNYYLSVTVAHISTPEKTSSDITAIKITPIADNQLMLSFLLFPGIATLGFVLVRKEVIQVLNNETIKTIKIKVRKYPIISSFLETVERELSDFRSSLKGEKND